MIRRVAIAIAFAAALLDVGLAILWRQWCRDHYTETEVEALLKEWP